MYVNILVSFNQMENLARKEILFLAYLCFHTIVCVDAISNSTQIIIFWPYLQVLWNKWSGVDRKGRAYCNNHSCAMLPKSRGSLQSDTTERLHFHFSLSCIGEGNGNPLQCSCLENPRDGKPGGLPSMGSHRVGHDWSNLTAAAAAAS